MQARRTRRLMRVYGPQTRQRPVQLLEHSVDSNGTLWTTVHKLCAKTIITNRQLRKSHVPKEGSQEATKDEVASHKFQMLSGCLNRLVEGIPLSPDKQRAFSTANDQENKPYAQTDPAIRAKGGELLSLNHTCCGRGSRNFPISHHLSQIEP